MVSPDPDLFPPELEELVMEFARDPRSSFLRTERPCRPSALHAPPDPLSRWTPGLTAAERELLDLHRDQLATLFLARWLTEVTVRPAKGSFAYAEGDAPDGADEAGVAEFLVGPAQVERWLHIGSAESLALALLEPERPLRSEELSCLVCAAVRLSPSVQARLYLCADLNRTGQQGSARRLSKELLTIEWRPGLRPYCWDALGSSLGNDWNPLDLVTCYERASLAPSPRVDAVATWLLLAVQAGDSTSSLRAAELLDALATSEDERVSRHVSEQVRTRHEGGWKPRALARRFLDDMLDRVGPTSRRILHVLE